MDVWTVVDFGAINTIDTSIQNPAVSATVSSNKLTISVNGSTSTVDLPVRKNKCAALIMNYIDYVPINGSAKVNSTISLSISSTPSTTMSMCHRIGSVGYNSGNLRYIEYPRNTSVANNTYYGQGIFAYPYDVDLTVNSYEDYENALDSYFEVYGYESFNAEIMARFCVGGRPNFRTSETRPVYDMHYYKLTVSYSKLDGFSVSDVTPFQGSDSKIYKHIQYSKDIMKEEGNDYKIYTGSYSLYVGFAISSITKTVYS